MARSTGPVRPPEKRHRVPFDRDVRLGRLSTSPPRGAPDGERCKRDLADVVEEIAELQRKLYADDRFALLCVFQAMDAAGKDSTIRKVFSGVNPAGFQVSSFKKPSTQELEHDFLWRTTLRLPERGRIGVFNRSHYEEVLVVRVHPDYLGAQRLPERSQWKKGMPPAAFWSRRLRAIVDHERHLAESGTVILKFFLNVSREEQKRRFLDRIDTLRKQWKFAAGDVEERRLWPKYMNAYQALLRATSKPWAPWYAIPADDKPYMRLAVAKTIEHTLRSLPLRYPEPSRRERSEMLALRAELERD